MIICYGFLDAVMSAVGGLKVGVAAIEQGNSPCYGVIICMFYNINFLLLLENFPFSV